MKGKVVLCDELTDATGPLNAGAVGTVMLNAGHDDYAFSFPLPATVLTSLDLRNVSAYINTTRYVTHSSHLLINFLSNLMLMFLSL